MNNVTLVGRLVNDPEVVELKDGTYKTIITIAVPRDYRNTDGEKITDFIKCVLWNGIASATKDYCYKGDIVGIKGKLQNLEENGILNVLAEKINFISSK